MQTSRMALSALAISASAGCLPPDAPASTADESAVVVGRLITRDGVVDLTVRAFADSQGPVPTGSYARLMADVDKGSVDDSRKTTPHSNALSNADDDLEAGSFLRRAF
jgi:hypothetical protein